MRDLVDAIERKASEGWEPFGSPERRARKMARIDALSADVKQVVHEYGWLTVKTLLEAGVTSAKQMRIVIKTVLYEHSHEYRAAKDGRVPVYIQQNPEAK